MLYPQNGNMAMGSRRTTPTFPVAAAVVSEDKVAPRNVPCCQLRASTTRGTRSCRRAPNNMASIGTPFGFSNSGEIDAHCTAGVVKRLLGCAAFSREDGVHGRPCQSRASAGGGSSCPSHHGVPSGLSATFVKMVLRWIMSKAFGLVARFVPGTTPKNPASGLTAHSRPSSPGRSHAISSPTVHIFHPGIERGTTIARFVFPHDEGNAAVR